MFSEPILLDVPLLAIQRQIEAIAAKASHTVSHGDSLAEVIRNIGATVLLHVLQKQKVEPFWPHLAIRAYKPMPQAGRNFLLIDWHRIYSF